MDRSPSLPELADHLVSLGAHALQSDIGFLCSLGRLLGYLPTPGSRGAARGARPAKGQDTGARPRQRQGEATRSQAE